MAVIRAAGALLLGSVLAAVLAVILLPCALLMLVLGPFLRLARG